MDISNNLLLYGPPGTGKTYNTVNYAVAIVEGRPLEDIVREGYGLALEKYDRYTKLGRIAFMTFHQSLSYDDFIEGIRPVVTEDNQLIYSATPGVFYRFCEEAESPRPVAPVPAGFERLGRDAALWGVDLGSESARRHCLGRGKIGLSSLDGDAKAGDLVVSLLPDGRMDAIGILGESADDLRRRSKTAKYADAEWVSLLEEPEPAGIDVGRNGVSAHGFLTRGKGAPDSGNCVFIIDEINRGNISRIFGELITLLESSRRKGMPECLEVYLPQMGVMFSVPQNVYVLGTMNTADKSLTALDTALRRRFEFVEMMPDPDVLKGRRVSDVDLSKLLATMNNRIELLYDREHMLGHAYFIGVRTMEDLARCFVKKVIPLLQEYFFDDYEKICWVLGKNSDPRQCGFITLRDRNRFQNSFNLPDVYDISKDWRVFMDPESYIQIYRGGEQ